MFQLLSVSSYSATFICRFSQIICRFSQIYLCIPPKLENFIWFAATSLSKAAFLMLQQKIKTEPREKFIRHTVRKKLWGYGSNQLQNPGQGSTSYASKFEIKVMLLNNDGFQIIASDESYSLPLFAIYENDSWLQIQITFSDNFRGLRLDLLSKRIVLSTYNKLHTLQWIWSSYSSL